MLVKEGSISRLVSETTGQVLRTWQQPVTLTPFGSQAGNHLDPGRKDLEADGPGWGILPARVPDGVTQTGSFQGQGGPGQRENRLGLMDGQGRLAGPGLKEIHSL